MSREYQPILKRNYKCAVDVKMVPCDSHFICHHIGFSLDWQNMNFEYATRMPLWVLAMRHNAVTPHDDSMDEKIKSNRHE